MDFIKKNSSLKNLLIIAGPTAVGKTDLSIKLASKFNCPIVSFDSRQFYREMNIGTAKPSQQELSQVPHHFIDTLSIHDHYTSGMYETEAIELLEKLFQKHDTVIAVGGSGLYINALCYGIDDIPSDEKIRRDLLERFQNEGLEKLRKEVEKCDPEFYQIADMQNPRRVIRALEVFLTTGKKYSTLRKNESKPRNFNSIWTGLELERSVLFDRINKRVLKMIDAGLVEEAESLFKHRQLKTLRTVGYQELFDFFEGKQTLEKSIELIQRNTRIFAKKQIAWFGKNKEIEWYLAVNQNVIMEDVQKKFLK